MTDDGAEVFQIQTSEKVPTRVILVARGSAGHGSLPRKDNAVAHLSDAISKLTKAYMPVQLNTTTRRYFTELAKLNEYKWLQPLLPKLEANANEIGDRDSELDAQFRTTVSPTMLRAGMKVNVIPNQAEAQLDVRRLPGETKEDFAELLQFIRETKFERAGVFRYSSEEGTKAYKLEGRVHHKTCESRWNQAMRELQGIAEEFNATQVQRTMRVLVEKPGIARTEMDAPEIDGTVFVDQGLPVGEFAEVTIGDWRGYDLVAAR